MDRKQRKLEREKQAMGPTAETNNPVCVFFKNFLVSLYKSLCETNRFLSPRRNFFLWRIFFSKKEFVLFFKRTQHFIQRLYWEQILKILKGVFKRIQLSIQYFAQQTADRHCSDNLYKLKKNRKQKLFRSGEFNKEVGLIDENRVWVGVATYDLM